MPLNTLNVTIWHHCTLRVNSTQFWFSPFLTLSQPFWQNLNTSISHSIILCQTLDTPTVRYTCYLYISATVSISFTATHITWQTRNKNTRRTVQETPWKWQNTLRGCTSAIDGWLNCRQLVYRQHIQHSAEYKRARLLKSFMLNTRPSRCNTSHHIWATN